MRWRVDIKQFFSYFFGNIITVSLLYYDYAEVNFCTILLLSLKYYVKILSLKINTSILFICTHFTSLLKH